MWRVIGCWVGVTALVMGTPTVAHPAPPGEAPAAAQPDAPADSPDAIVCQLLAGCPSSDPAAAPRGGRVSATRGFTFREAEAPAAATGRYDLRIGFLFASAELTAADRARTAAFAEALRDPRIAGRRIRIEGHTDSIGSDAANLDLSRRRARAVGEALAQAGIDGSRIDLEGYGASRPLPGIPTDSGANRRVIASLVQ